MLDDLPLSPELVLVSPPQEAAWERSLWAQRPQPLPEPVRMHSELNRGEIAAVYAVSLAITLVPLALTLLTVPARH